MRGLLPCGTCPLLIAKRTAVSPLSLSPSPWTRAVTAVSPARSAANIRRWSSDTSRPLVVRTMSAGRRGFHPFLAMSRAIRPRVCPSLVVKLTRGWVYSTLASSTHSTPGFSRTPICRFGGGRGSRCTSRQNARLPTIRASVATSR